MNLKKFKGKSFIANIHGNPSTGKIQVEDDEVYLCQNDLDGADCIEKLGYNYSWGIGEGWTEDLYEYGVTDFKILR